MNWQQSLFLKTLGGCVIIGLTSTPLAFAQTNLPQAETPSSAQAKPLVALEWSGLADFHFSYFDFGRNQNLEGGSQRDKRLVFDANRFALGLEGKTQYGFSFDAEVEFEHGGTGASKELENSEFGEFETDVEKGGEIFVEEMKVSYAFSDHISASVGRLPLALGWQNKSSGPMKHLSVFGNEAERTLLPKSWSEIGAELNVALPYGSLSLQIINGLDSSGFSSQKWVAEGYQKRFELVTATDIAAVLRLDAAHSDLGNIGFSVYSGGTSRNRPKADLVKDCTSADRTDKVAPCGYIDGRVTIIDAHANVEIDNLKISTAGLWGFLKNADDISERNKRLSNKLTVLRTPVGERAFAAWGEVGYNMASIFNMPSEDGLWPFVRVDTADTMVAPREDLYDNPRFEKTKYTAGIALFKAKIFFAKLDYSHRKFGSSNLRTENEVNLGTGLVF